MKEQGHFNAMQNNVEGIEKHALKAQYLPMHSDKKETELKRLV